MRQLNLNSQAKNRSINFDLLSTDAAMSVLAMKPVEEFVQGASSLPVTVGSSNAAITLDGPFLFSDSALYSDAESRIVNKGKFAYRSTDSVHEKAKVVLLNAADNTPIQDSQGKELVAFLRVDVSANTVSLEFHVDNGNGTYSAAVVPAGVTSVLYQFLQRFSFDEIRPEVTSTKKFFHGVVDVAVDNDLNQLLKDVYGPTGSFNGTGQAALGSGQSVVERLDDLVVDLAAETADRQSEDALLQSAITAEESRAMAEEAGIRADFASADSALQASLQSEIDSEEARALAAEGVLQSNIESGDADEALARQGADEALQSSIDAEALARQGADEALQANIDAEASARQSADEALQASIDAEASARQSDVSDLSGRVDTLESTFEVQEYASLGNFPAVGLPATLYIDKAANEAYRFQSSAAPASYDVTVNSGDDLAAAVAAASEGQSIKVSAGTYTLSSTLLIDKALTLVGDGIGQTIIKSAGTSSDPVNLISITANNVTMKGLTIQHLKTSNTSIEAAVLVSGSGFPQTRVSGFQMDACRVEYMEFGVVVRGESWKIVNSELHYSGPTNSTRRAIGVYGSKGQVFVKGNAFTDNGATGTQRAIALTSSTGSNPNETYEDTLSIEDNTFVGGQASLAQFYNQDSFQAGAAPFNLVVKNNTAQESSAFVVVYGSAANFGNVFGEVTISGNTLSGSHGGTPLGTKGAFAIDGTAAFRSSALPIHISNNTLTTTTTYRTGWNALSGTDVGYASALGSIPSLTVDASIPASLSVPATNAPSASNVSEYVLLGNSWVTPLADEQAARIAGDAATLSSAEDYTDQKIADLVNGAPELLDTLKEIADQLTADGSAAVALANTVAANLVEAKAYTDTEVAAEEARALAAEAALQAEIDAEEVRALAAEAALQADIDAEEARAMAEEADIRLDFAAADAAIQAELDVEEARALAAEAALEVALDAEESRAMAEEADIRVDFAAADAALQAELDAEEARAMAEEADIRVDFAAADAALQAELDAEEARAMAEEADIRVDFAAADAALQSELDAEEARALAAEGVLQANIDSEASARVSGDNTLQASINSVLSQLNSFKSLIGNPVDMETVTFAEDGSYILSQAPSGIVSGSKPMLAINGVLQEISEDYSVVADAQGVVRKVQLVLNGKTIEQLQGSNGTAVIWYRAVM